MKKSKVYVNGQEIRSFDNDNAALDFAGSLYGGKQAGYQFNKNNDTLEVETGEGRRKIQQEDLDQATGKIKVHA
jgi:hypothetical protein